MSREPDRGLMIELIEAMDRRDELATERLSFIASYKTALAERTKRVTDQDKRICEIREEMKAPQQSGRPILAAIAKGGGNGKIADAEARAAFAHTGAADVIIDPMAAADRRIASALIGPPDHKEDYVEKSAAKPPVIPPGDSTDDERKRRQVEYSSAGTPEPDEGITDRHAAAYVNRQSPPRPHPVVGPYNQDDALLRACAWSPASWTRCGPGRRTTRFSRP